MLRLVSLWLFSLFTAVTEGIIELHVLVWDLFIQFQWFYSDKLTTVSESLPRINNTSPRSTTPETGNLFPGKFRSKTPISSDLQIYFTNSKVKHKRKCATSKIRLNIQFFTQYATRKMLVT